MGSLGSLSGGKWVGGPHPPDSLPRLVSLWYTLIWKNLDFNYQPPDANNEIQIPLYLYLSVHLTFYILYCLCMVFYVIKLT